MESKYPDKLLTQCQGKLLTSSFSYSGETKTYLKTREDDRELILMRVLESYQDKSI